MMEQERIDGKPSRAVVLDGSRSDDSEAGLGREAVQKELERAGIKFSLHVLRDARIAACTGCHRCWTTTPGECAMDDDQKAICKELARSDLLVLVTPVTFGGYSSELKKSIDRMLPILLPYFKEFDGETHHPSRYATGLDLFAVGTLCEQDEDKERTFKDLVLRNSVNMHSKREASCVVFKGSDEKEASHTVAAELRKVIA